VTGIAAVVFDVGGVLTESPVHAVARFERTHGLAPGTVARVLEAAGEAGAWARLERGELSLHAFYPAFEADCRALGVSLDARALMAAVQAAMTPRPPMLAAVSRLRRHGFRVGALTNNWAWTDPPAEHPLRPHFDAFVESSRVGLRKPDPRIYGLVCRELGVPPARTAFLDDLGANLKPARALGMLTIKVAEPVQALRELGGVLGIDLLAEAG
jgi:putative hydrolase of the HAD superfamily